MRKGPRIEDRPPGVGRLGEHCPRRGSKVARCAIVIDTSNLLGESVTGLVLAASSCQALEL